MDRFDAGIVVAAVTLSIHPLIVYGAGVVAVVVILYFAEIRPAIRRAIRRAKVRQKKQAWLDSVIKEEKRNELEKLFPPSWLELYDVIVQCNNNIDRMRKLYDLTEECHIICLISKAACYELANAVSYGCGDPNHKLAMSWLSKFQGPESDEPPTRRQFEQLPKPWRDFALELINYPAAYSLCLEKVCWGKSNKSNQHPCCKVPLTGEQAAIFAGAVAKNDSEKESFARVLAPFITLESEIRKAESDYNYCVRCDQKLDDCRCGDSKPMPRCPKCGGYMIIINGGNGGSRFYGCAKFPSCKGTRDFA